MADNKIGKYLLYALGEIVLVVIGILIALSINTWSETRKNKVKEEVLLKNLLIELEADQLRVKTGIETHAFIEDAMEKYLGMMSQEKVDIPEDSIQQLLAALLYDPVYQPRLSVMNSALSSGQISVITNDSLVSEISSWAGYLEEYRHETDIMQNNSSQLTSPYLFDKMSFVDARMVTSDMPGKSAFDFDYVSLLSDPKIEHLAELKRLNLVLSKDRLMSLDSLQKRMIKLIHSSLDSDK